MSGSGCSFKTTLVTVCKLLNLCRVSVPEQREWSLIGMAR
jgi:hypothetical protein